MARRLTHTASPNRQVKFNCRTYLRQRGDCMIWEYHEYSLIFSNRNGFGLANYNLSKRDSVPRARNNGSINLICTLENR